MSCVVSKQVSNYVSWEFDQKKGLILSFASYCSLYYSSYIFEAYTSAYEFFLWERNLRGIAKRFYSHQQIRGTSFRGIIITKFNSSPQADYYWLMLRCTHSALPSPSRRREAKQNTSHTAAKTSTIWCRSGNLRVGASSAANPNTSTSPPYSIDFVSLA